MGFSCFLIILKANFRKLVVLVNRFFAWVFVFVPGVIRFELIQSSTSHFLILGADSLCGRLTEKINSNHNHKLILAHMPLLMVCLEGLGKLAQKFPQIVASTCICCLRDFLITPSPILLKLHRQAVEKTNKDSLKITGKPDNEP